MAFSPECIASCGALFDRRILMREVQIALQ
jgi:hypothetical protein